MSFVSVPREALVRFLEERKFALRPGHGELVYEYRHPVQGMRIRVYTSVDGHSTVARACGKDAIRVTLVWDPDAPVLGIRPTPIGLRSYKVLRTGTVERVLERLRERMRDAWREAKMIPRCPRCGTPAYEDSGRCRIRECREGVA